jgi:hypothetical protein
VSIAGKMSALGWEDISEELISEMALFHKESSRERQSRMACGDTIPDTRTQPLCSSAMFASVPNMLAMQATITALPFIRIKCCVIALVTALPSPLTTHAQKTFSTSQTRAIHDIASSDLSKSTPCLIWLINARHASTRS